MASAPRPPARPPVLTGKTIASAMASKPAISIINAPAPAKTPIQSMPTAASQIVTAQSLPQAPSTDARHFTAGQAPKGMASLPTNNAPREFQKIMGVAPTSGPAPLNPALVANTNPVSGGFVPPTPDASSGGSGGGNDSGGGSGGSSDSGQSQQASQQDDGGQTQESGGSDSSDSSDSSDDSGDSGDAPPDDGSSDEEGFGNEKFPRFSAYIQGDRLCAFGLVKTQWGIAPLVTVVRLPGEVTRNGPPQFGADPDIDSAMQETKARLMKGSDLESIRLCAESLVRRANQGDQNARALINRIGKNATTGNERAIHAKQCIEHYCSLHPNDPNQPTMFGMDAPRKSYHRGAVRLANGPSITSNRVRELASTFGGKHARHRKLILKAASSFGEDRGDKSLAERLDANERGLYELGQCIGMALGIQCVRAGGPISKLSKQAAWELNAK